MDLAGGVFDARHGDNTDVLLALLTQNKELEGKQLHIVYNVNKIFEKMHIS